MSEEETKREAEAFKQWFASQRRFGSLAAMERALGITKDYLHLIRDGKRHATDLELRRKLFEATGLEIFKIDTSLPESASSSLKENSAKDNGKPRVSPSYERRTGSLTNLPDQLKTALKKLKMTVHQCSQKYGISPNMLKKYKRGISFPTSEKNVSAVLKILEDAGLVSHEEIALGKTHAEDIKHHTPTDILTNEIHLLRKKIDEIDRRLSAANLYGPVDLEPRSSGVTEMEIRARRIVQILLQLSGELEFFKRCSEEGRKTFRKTVPGPDVGYVITLLRALYDEDKFQRWLLFSDYEMQGRTKGG
jgi:transcriptional regulator with XRE-family HTH domain